MKTSVAPAIVLCALLASCGGGSSDNTTLNDNAQAGLPADSSTTPSTDSSIDPLTDLYGQVEMTYGFTDTADIFTLTVEFNADSQSAGNNSLAGTAKTTRQASPDATPTQGSELIIGCFYADSVGDFLCVADAQGPEHSLFGFGRTTNGSASGSFEFCDGATNEECTIGLRSSPDGSVSVAVNGLQATIPADARAAFSETVTDLLPYLRYLKQGSVGTD